jgi:biotin carboxyl carrier protein
MAAIASTVYAYLNRSTNTELLRAMPSGWRNSFYTHQKDTYIINEITVVVEYRNLYDHLELLVNGDSFKVVPISSSQNELKMEMDGRLLTYFVSQKVNKYFVHNATVGNIVLLKKDRLPIKEKEKVVGGYESPMPCSIVKVNVKVGDNTKKGQALLVLSSMKMESVIEASEDGVVKEVYVTEGQNIEAGYLMLKMKENQKES